MNFSKIEYFRFFHRLVDLVHQDLSLADQFLKFKVISIRSYLELHGVGFVVGVLDREESINIFILFYFLIRSWILILFLKEAK